MVQLSRSKGKKQVSTCRFSRIMQEFEVRQVQKTYTLAIFRKSDNRRSGSWAFTIFDDSWRLSFLFSQSKRMLVLKYRERKDKEKSFDAGGGAWSWLTQKRTMIATHEFVVPRSEGMMHRVSHCSVNKWMARLAKLTDTEYRSGDLFFCGCISQL